MSLKHKLTKATIAIERQAARLVDDTRGGVMVEYTVLIGAVAIAGSVGLVAVGIAVAKNFEFVRGMLLVPIP
jgi:Flp pilus assembly pilin Flp